MFDPSVIHFMHFPTRSHIEQVRQSPKICPGSTTGGADLYSLALIVDPQLQELIAGLIMAPLQRQMQINTDSKHLWHIKE